MTLMKKMSDIQGIQHIRLKDLPVEHLNLVLRAGLIVPLHSNDNEHSPEPLFQIDRDRCSHILHPVTSAARPSLMAEVLQTTRFTWRYCV